MSTPVALIGRALRVALMVALLLALFGLNSGVARAATPDPEIQRKTRALVERGHKALRDKKFKEALNSFNEAYRMWPRKEIQFNLALVYRETGDKIAAVTHLRMYLKQAGPGARAALPVVFRRLLTQVGVLSVVAPKPVATIWLGGRKVGSGRVELVLLPGVHVVEVRLGRQVLSHREVRLAGGQEIVWNPTLIERRPAARLGPPVVVPRVTPRKRLHWAYFAAATIVAAAAGGALIYTGIRTRDLESQYSSAPSLDLREEGTRYMNATNVLIGVAGAAAITAAVFAFYTRWRGGGASGAGERADRATLIPGVWANGATLSIRWRH
jgi:hypothetical protein